MKLTTCLLLAEELFEIHGLDADWTFEFDGSKVRRGYCKWREKVISMSRHLIPSMDDADVLDTLLHEIAHALTPYEYHSPVWREKAISIGCSGERCATDNAVTEPNYIGTCPGNHTHHGFRLRKRVSSCAKCSPTFDPRYIIVWEKVK